MKNINLWLLIILLLLSCKPEKIEKMAVYVPDTTTFTLENVVDAIEDHAGNIDDDLETCFYYSIPSYFDTSYNTNSYAVASSLKRFRNYGPGSGDDLVVPEGFSPNGDDVHDYFEVANLEYFPVHKMSIYAPPAGFIYGGGSVSGGTKLYEKINDYDDHPWDGTYNGYDCPEINYVWVLEINGASYDNGTVLIAR